MLNLRKKKKTAEIKEPFITEPEELKVSKDRLRKEAKETLASLSQKDLKDRIHDGIQRLKKISEFKSARKILVYYPMDGEIDLSDLVKDFADPNYDPSKSKRGRPSAKYKTWVLPRALGKGIMVLFETGSFEGLQEGKYGIKVPAGTNPLVKKDEIDLAIIPGLSFDKKGYRLGRGGGYFDRFLQDSKTKSIGICFKEQLQDALPHANHDKPVDYVLEI